MSETIYYPVETQLQMPESETLIYESTDSPEKNEQWGDALYDLVATNADVIVRCQWMGDSEVTLSTAMTTYDYPPGLTAKDEPFLISVVEQLLTNRVTEIEELEREEETEKIAENEESRIKDDNETVVQTTKTNPESVKTQKQSEIEIDTFQQVQQSKVRAESLSPKISNVKSTVNEATDKVRAPLKSHTQPASMPSRMDSSTPEVVTEETNQEFTPIEQSAPAPRSARVEVKSEPQPLQVDTGNNQPVTGGVEEMVSIKSEITQQAPMEHDELEFPVNSMEMTGESIVISEDEPMLTDNDFSKTAIDEPDLYESLALSNENEWTPDIEMNQSDSYTTDVISWEVEVTHQNTGEQFISDETLTVESGIPLDLSIKEIEESLVQLTKHIETSQPATVETVNQILDKITKLETPSGESATTEVEVQEKAEELFIELFDVLNVNYTAELVESLADLFQQRHFVEKIEKLMSKEETGDEPKDSGTHEIVKKIIVALSSLKKAIVHAPAIGKSALRLYSAASNLRYLTS